MLCRYTKRRLQSLSAQIADLLNVEFSDVEVWQIAAIQVDHIAMRNTTGRTGAKQCEIITPLEGFRTHKPVVGTIKMANQMICKIQREFAAGSPV